MHFPDIKETWEVIIFEAVFGFLHWQKLPLQPLATLLIFFLVSK